MSDMQNTTEEEALCETKLHIKLTDKGIFIYGGWSSDRLLNLLKDKFLRRNNIKLYDAQYDVSSDESLHFIIHSGMYNECILLKLEEKGMSPQSIVKAMKYGLLRLTSEELKYFQDFGVEINADTWMKKLDDKFIWNLAAIGLTEDQCWIIVTCGLMSQDKNILYRLLSSGIDVPGILNWQGKVKPVSPTIIRFLKKLGIDEDTCNYIKENGIDDEAEDILIDLGYNEYKKKEALEVTEEILCHCDLTILESYSTFLEEKFPDTISDNSLKSSCSCSLDEIIFSNIFVTSMQCNSALCPCYLNLLPKERASKALTRNDYLKQNVLVPLSWAISRALRYCPSDPIHYIAHQLLRWKYGNVSQEEVRDVQKFIASKTLLIDQKLMQERKREGENFIRCSNKTVVKDIACVVCSDQQKLYRIKERYWKCTKMPMCDRLLQQTKIKYAKKVIH
ncbi:PREDICTED: uncharacterized protein LOC108778604 [Cyphomyrmex costatus]|uniref:uncharacterized protein LOC108778604 n=1 Tax=Cyphomyrmex costatus TaxID=456900 RepID=UPI00085239AE|nr:PREDICTED: uncharacterized protein LOC108778604 [Cyphomyrmex costatus]